MQATESLYENKIILGYTLKKRIGSGGFGEVWSAIAPGGLQKAVKIVYGYHDEKRAQTELKALDRVKELRHPFLLSLERIEVFEGQLIVVSELADKSLADLFNEFQKKGEPGLPRELLLKFMRSSADALDYLSQEHNLQHLDIKPENLLILGGHVKVADFGLMKELNNMSQSLISGLTPVYAAPEVFDGRPGKHSDQYSLAVVYQEMLTGQRPFPGSTPAQLAAQHVHGKPNLRSLPPSDQPMIAKALAKDPNLRFPCCRVMAEELSHVKRASRTAIRRLQPMTNPRAHHDTQHKTVSLGDHDATALVSSDSLPFQAKEIKLLDPPNSDPAAAKVRPTLVIGVGASANRVIGMLKRQLIARHGSLQNLPAIRLLCFDSDRNEITRLCMADDDSAMSTRETLATPLMKPEAYRENAGTRLSWLSRRWIFNIPRSLQTEGLRPLGRLAFTEHFDAICERIESTLKEIVKPELLARTSEELAMDPGPLQPQVIVVSSISGGIGSGMTLDLAYTIRLLLAEQGFEMDDYELIGVLLHSTYQRSRDPGLSATNAFAFFTELRYFIESGYPGDKSIGIPEFGKIPPFDFTYFNELGCDLSQSDFERQLVNVAEYLYLSWMSKCSVFFSGCRAIEEEQEHFSLRTFGLSATGPESFAARTESVLKIAGSMVQRWLKGRPDVNFDGSQKIESKFRELELSPESVIERITQTSNQILQNPPDLIIQDAIQKTLDAKLDPDKELSAYLDGALGAVDKSNQSKLQEHDPEVCFEFEEQIRQLALQNGRLIARQINEQLDHQNINLAGAKFLEANWISRLELMGSEINRLSDQLREQLARAAALIRQIAKEKVNKQQEQQTYQRVIAQYCQMRFEEFVLRFSRRYYQAIILQLAQGKDLIFHFEKSINDLNRQIQTKVNSLTFGGSESRTQMENLLIQGVEKHLDSHIAQTEIQIYQSLVANLGGFIEFFNHSSLLKQLPTEILSAAQRVLADAYQKVSLEEALDENGIGIEQVVKWIHDQVRLAQPKVHDCGGSLRVLLGLPSLTAKSILPELVKHQFDITAMPIKGTRGSFVFCFEGEDVALANVAFRLLQYRPDAIDLVKRIHTRNDIPWSTLNDLL